MIAVRHIPTIIITCTIGWLSWHTYTYFLDSTKPSFIVTGIHDKHYYCDDIACFMSSDKSGLISAWLDGKQILQKIKIKAQQETQPLTIDTKTLSNGKHILKVDIIDTNYHRNSASHEYDFFVDNEPLQAVFKNVGQSYKVPQGRTVHIALSTNKEIKSAYIETLSHSYQCFADTHNPTLYECFIPIECEAQPNEYLVTAHIEDKVGNIVNLDNKLAITAYPFKKETLVVTADKIQEEKSLGKESRALETEIEKLSLQSPPEKLWRGQFCVPIEVQRITCDYGTVRTTQHKGRYAHKAIDMINAPKSVVWATQDGIIALKDRFANSGNTVIIDHGMGVLSLFYHLDSFADIEVGQKIYQGNPIGTIGKTGFATGYHLHWEMRINNIPVDPMQWITMI